MRLIIALLFATLIAPCLAPGTILADGMDLYRGSVAVEDRSASARDAAFPGALKQVMSKLSGLRSLDDNPDVEAAVQDARSLVLSFYYEQSETAGPGAPVAEMTQEAPLNFLTVRFSAPAVDELMSGLGLPRWPANREALEIWILVDDGLSRRVLPLEYEYLRTTIERVAEKRGLPLRWPSAGPEGDYGVDLQLLWGGYTEAVTPEGDEPSVLVVAARREGPEWSTRQILEYAGSHWSWRNRDIDLGRALLEALHQVVDQVAALQAIAPSDQGSWTHEIVVSGLRSAADYTRCMAYLESLAVVEEIVIRSATSSEVRMVLSLNADPRYFDQEVADDPVLEYAELSGQYVMQR